MLFNSFGFAAFLGIVFLLRWKLDNKYTDIVLVVANVVFVFLFGWQCLLWAAIITLFSFVGARILDNNDGNKRKMILCVIIMSEALVLGVSKHIPGIIESTSMLMPIGMSFYIFRNISYVVEVYKGTRAEKNIIKYVNYSLFFSSFSSGPIDRYHDLVPQFESKQVFNYENISRGLIRFLWGLYKKIVVSGHMSFYTEWVYNDIYSHTGFSLLFASALYTIQIYCDFSGYTDMAIGVANMLGYDIKENFKSPYFAESVGDFWRKWHISLSSWLRDYIYIPLGGSRCGLLRNSINIILTFAVSGIWHGATANFFIWGLLHGIAQVVEKIFGVVKPQKRVGKFARWILVLGFINFTWVIFRLTSLKEITYFFSHLLEGINNPISYFVSTQQSLNIDAMTLVRLIFISSSVMVFDFYDMQKSIFDRIVNLSRRRRLICCIVMVLFTYMLLPVKPATDYIYFRF